MRINVFEGARRILRLVQALWVIGAFVVAWITAPYVHTAYVTAGPDKPFVRSPAGFYCGSSSATEYEYRTTPKGTYVSAALCFQASNHDNRLLVPYKVADGQYYGNDYLSSDVTNYTSQRARHFTLPEADIAYFDEQQWDNHLSNLRLGTLCGSDWRRRVVGVRTHCGMDSAWLRRHSHAPGQ